MTNWFLAQRPSEAEIVTEIMPRTKKHISNSVYLAQLP